MTIQEVPEQMNKKQLTSSSRSPINSSAAECLRLSASSSARIPGSVAASALSFSHYQ